MPGHTQAANAAQLGAACNGPGTTQLASNDSSVLACLDSKWTVTMPPMPACNPGTEAVTYDGTNFRCIGLSSPNSLDPPPVSPNTSPKFGAGCGTVGMTQMTRDGSAIYACLNGKTWRTSLPPMPTCSSTQALTYDGTNFLCADLNCDGLTNAAPPPNANGGAAFGSACEALGMTQMAGDDSDILLCKPGAGGALQWGVSFPAVPTCQSQQVLTYNGANFQCVALNCTPVNTCGFSSGFEMPAWKPPFGPLGQYPAVYPSTGLCAAGSTATNLMPIGGGNTFTVGGDGGTIGGGPGWQWQCTASDDQKCGCLAHWYTAILLVTPDSSGDATVTVSTGGADSIEVVVPGTSTYRSGGTFGPVHCAGLNGVMPGSLAISVTGAISGGDYQITASCNGAPISYDPGFVPGWASESSCQPAPADSSLPTK